MSWFKYDSTLLCILPLRCVLQDVSTGRLSLMRDTSATAAFIDNALNPVLVASLAPGLLRAERG